MADMQDQNADDQTQDDTGASDDGGDDVSQGTVLLTVLKNSDGTYQLIEGDEDDTSAGEGGEGSDDAASQGTTYDSAAKLLKGILDCLRKDEEGDSGSPQANFEAGYAGDSGSSAKGPMAG